MDSRRYECKRIVLLTADKQADAVVLCEEVVVTRRIEIAVKSDY